MNLTITTQGVFSSDAALKAIALLDKNIRIETDGSKKILHMGDMAVERVAGVALSFVRACNSNIFYTGECDFQIEGDKAHLTINRSFDHTMFD